MENATLKKAWLLFLNTFTISMTANSGYAMLGVIKNRFVEKYGWFTKEEMEDYIALAQSCPGPIIVNSSTFIGMKLAGIQGAIAATLACVIPGMIVSLLLVWLYTRYKEIPVITEMIRTLKCMSVALIFSVLLKMFMSAVFPEGIGFTNMNVLTLVMVVLSFYILKRYKTNPLLVMLMCGAINLVVSLIIK